MSSQPWTWHSQAPNSPISKYALRTKLFCLTRFLVVTLSAAFHSSELVSAGSALLYTRDWTFLSFVCMVFQMSRNHHPPASPSCWLYVGKQEPEELVNILCIVIGANWMVFMKNKSILSIWVLCFSSKTLCLWIKRHQQFPESNKWQGEFLQYHFFK